MKILYIYPHPDDESFGPGHVMHYQVRQGHEVYLLTLTKGGATRQRHKYGYSIAEMGEVRYQEMIKVAKALRLTGIRDFISKQSVFEIYQEDHKLPLKDLFAGL